MSRELLWKADIEHWDKISIESYQFVFEQAKESLEEEINESKAITGACMKTLLVYVTSLSGLTGFIFSDQSNINHGLLTVVVAGIIAIFSIYIFTLLFALISTEKDFGKGSQPKEILKKEIVNSLNSQAGFKNLLLNEIERIQEKIERIQTNNKKRINQYKSVLQLSLILVAVLVFALVRRIISGS